MFLFGLEGSGFIIAVALTLLVSGAIMFYCLKRFSVIESAITEQGKILQSFIQNSQLSTINGGLASSIALDSAREQTSSENTNDNDIKSLNIENSLSDKKIEVSDDSDDSEEDSDDDDDDDDDDNDSKKSFNLENLEDKNIDLESLSVEDIVFSKISDDADVKIIAAGVIEVDDLTSISNKDKSNDDTLEKIEDITNLDEVTDLTSDVKLEKLKVGDLRLLVVEKNLVDSSTMAQKMKKEELLKLLN